MIHRRFQLKNTLVRHAALLGVLRFMLHPMFASQPDSPSPAPRLSGPTKLFDSDAGFGAITNLATLTDASVARRGDQWWLFLAGMDRTTRTIRLFSARAPAGAPLESAPWAIVTKPGEPSIAQPLVEGPTAGSWDGTGLHCPCYVRGLDPSAPAANAGWKERIYYAGSNNRTFLGPYSIGYVEWNGETWVPAQPGPVFAATERWECGSVCEPNLVYDAGKWRMWYAFGPTPKGRFGIGYAESRDGRTDWSRHQVCFAEAENIFDFNVVVVGDHLEAIAARNPWAPPDHGPKPGLFWTRTTDPHNGPGEWLRSWVPLLHRDEGSDWTRNGIWKPSFQRSEADPSHVIVFFDASYPSGLTPPQRPFHLATGRAVFQLGQP